MIDLTDMLAAISEELFCFSPMYCCQLISLYYWTHVPAKQFADFGSKFLLLQVLSNALAVLQLPKLVAAW